MTTAVPGRPRVKRNTRRWVNQKSRMNHRGGSRGWRFGSDMFAHTHRGSSWPGPGGSGDRKEEHHLDDAGGDEIGSPESKVVDGGEQSLTRRSRRAGAGTLTCSNVALRDCSRTRRRTIASSVLAPHRTGFRGTDRRLVARCGSWLALESSLWPRWRWPSLCSQEVVTTTTTIPDTFHRRPQPMIGCRPRDRKSVV